MDVSVLAVDANGLALGAKETADKVEVKVLDKDGTPKAAAVTGTVVDATQLAKGDYTVVVSVDKTS